MQSRVSSSSTNPRSSFFAQILKNKKHPEYRKILAECGEACNVTGRFDFTAFNLAERQQALREALASTASTQTGSKMYTTQLGGFGGNLGDLLRGRVGKGQRVVENPQVSVCSDMSFLQVQGLQAVKPPSGQ